MAAPPGTGGVAGPQGNPGNTLAAIAKVRTALLLIQTALPSIPMGSDFHSDLLKTVSNLAKHIPDVGVGADQQQIQQLRLAAQQVAAQQPHAQLAQIAAPPPNSPPAMAPPPPGPPGSPGGGTANVDVAA